jgi:hypothetical protein
LLGNGPGPESRQQLVLDALILVTGSGVAIVFDSLTLLPFSSFSFLSGGLARAKLTPVTSARAMSGNTSLVRIGGGS